MRKQDKAFSAVGKKTLMDSSFSASLRKKTHASKKAVNKLRFSLSECRLVCFGGREEGEEYKEKALRVLKKAENQ